jgi:hypothetical protein
VIVSDVHELVDAFADGELEAEEAAAFRAHLPDCAQCQRELHELMMLAAVTQTHAAALRTSAPTAEATAANVAATARPDAVVAPAGKPDAVAPAGKPDAVAPAGKPDAVALAGRLDTVTLAGRAEPATGGAQVIVLASRRRRVWGAALATFAAAAALVVGWRVTRPEPIVLAQAETRPLEARLSYRGADRYRPYEVMRAMGPLREDVPLTTLARLEHDRDLHGLGVGYLLGGDGARAAEALAGAGDSAAVQSDRAALALQQHDALAALAAADAALHKEPGQAEASWNRALALRDLGLPLTAAQTFDAVAAHGEAGWADEARRRASSLRAAEAERERAYRAAAAAGKAMIASGAVPEGEVVRAFGGLMRRDLYEAARTAPTRARMLALLPVSDAVESGHALSERLRSAASDAPRRAALAATYARLVANPASLRPAEADAFLAALAKAGADDLRLGALVLLGRVATSRAEVRRIAAAQSDPWWLSLADEADAEAALAAGDAAGAERLLGDADRRCLAAGIDFRCATLELALADAQLRQRRLAEARATALVGLGRARAAGVDPRDLERRFLLLLAEVARANAQPGLAAAYVAEARLRMP